MEAGRQPQEGTAMKQALLLLAVVTLVAVAAPAQGQYMFLDTNNDGVCDTNDILTPASTSIDVWLDTDSNAGGGAATCAVSSNLLTINSYEIILRASGAVTFADPATGGWTDNMSFATVLGNAVAGTDVYMGRGSGTILSPGTYKLGSIAISGVAAGTSVAIVTSTTASPTAGTTFGSACEGNDFDNTMKLGSDWNDTCGSITGTPVTATTWGQIKNLYR
jgi:hypothetical protein